MTDDDELTLLRAENQALRAQLDQVLAQLAQVSDQLATAQTRIAELEQQRQALPPFVNPNKPAPAEPKPKRKKRAAQHNHGRRRETPTQIVPHALERCPDCDYLLQGNSLAYTRQVIDLPAPQPIDIIEHQVFKRWCPHCRRWHRPKLELAGVVLGQGRIGVRMVAVIAFLRNSLRVPIRRIQAYLQAIHQFRISAGEIVELLHQLRATLQSAITDLKRQARASPILHADETGWRENGRNGYIWAFSTPGDTAVRSYEYDHSRGQAVVKRVLDGQFAGHLVSDFYAGYNQYAGKHQRCWTHLLRDLHALKADHGQDAAVQAWAEDVRACYDDAQAWLTAHAQAAPADREAQYVALTSRTHALGLAYARANGHACGALAKRLLRHEDELFQFVLVEGLSADNNLAERSIRPLVIIRKISGGSRSADGTKTRMGLASLFETWQARNLNPFAECLTQLKQLASSPT